MTPSERSTVKANRARAQRASTATRFTYECRWPIIDDGFTITELAAEALPDVRYAIAAAGAHQTGPPKWDVSEVDGQLTLTVRVPCMRSKGARERDVDDDAVAHLLHEGVTTSRIAAMMGVPRETIELAALRCQHRTAHDDDRDGEEFEQALDGLGLTNIDRTGWVA